MIPFPKRMAPSLTLVFPMHNEEACVRRAVDAAREGAGPVTDDLEIVIVEDGSTARTREVTETRARIELRSQGSFIDAELLVRARNAGARIIRMGLDCFPCRGGRSTVSSPQVIAGILAEVVRLGPGLWLGPRLPATSPRGQ